MSSSTRRRGLLVAIFALYLASVPWYRAPDPDPALWFGLPDWVAVALLCYVGVALLNAAAWLSTDVPDVPAPPDAGRDGDPPDGGAERER